MPYIKCSACSGWHDSSVSGCTAASCSLGDQAKVQRIATTPKHPLTKKAILPSGSSASMKSSASGPSVVQQPKQSMVDLSLKKGASLAPAPVAIAKHQGEELLDNDMQDLEAGYHILYRGDSRSPATIKASGGFSAWVPLDVATARQVIRRALGKNFEISFPKKGKRLQDAFNAKGGQNLTLLTLGRQIKLEKANDTFHISTDPSENCGGYASGYIYGMRFKKIYLVDKNNNASSFKKSDLSRINVKYVLDAETLDAASLIAVAVDPDEVAFLTTISVGHIYKYKEPKGKIWYKMPS